MSHQRNPFMTSSANRLSVKEKIAYGLGDTASNIVFQVVANFMLVFYTDVFGIGAAAAGTLLLVVRIFDAITDPLMGGIADRTRTRFGSYRPYLLYLAIPYGILAVMAFSVPDFSDSGKLIYAYVSYAAMMLLYTCINIPYAALGGALTSNSKERASLQSYRFAMAMTGLLLVVSGVPLLVDWLGQGDDAAGYQYAMMVLAVVAVLCFLACFKFTKEKQPPQPLEKGRTIYGDFFSLFKNDQWVLVSGVSVCLLTLVALRGSVTPHYVKYYLGDESLMASFMTLGGIASVLGATCTILFSKYIDNKKLFIAGLVVGIISHALLFMFPSEQVEAIYVTFIVANFAHMVVTPILFSMVADTVDYGALKTGRRMMAMTFSGHLLAIKLGFAIGGASAGWLLAAYSYIPNEIQSAETLQGILIAFSAVPVVLLTASLVLILRYKLTESYLQGVQQKLEKQSAFTIQEPTINASEKAPV